MPLAPGADGVRIVSLAPGATATLAAMGAAESLVAVTNHAPEAALDADPERLGGWLDPDLDRVAALEPDLVLTGDALQSDVAAALAERDLPAFHRTPETLSAVVDSFAALGAAVDRPAAGRALRDRCRARLDRVADAVAGRERPTVYCEEWPDPPMVAGNWVPAAVAAAGGRYPLVDAGERSRAVDPEAVAAADPDRVVLHYCGYGDRADPDAVRGREGWELDGVPIHVLHDDLLNRPSPELVDGVERLAALLHGVDVGDDHLAGVGDCDDARVDDPAAHADDA